VGGIYCENEACELYHTDQRNYGKPRTSITTFHGDSSSRYAAFGKPSQGEENVPRTCETFLAVLRRDRKLEFGDLEDLSANSEHPGIDARARRPDGSYLNMQVTRALPQDLYEEQGRTAFVLRKHAPLEPASMLRAAIESKRQRACSNITLLIDAKNAPHLAFLTSAHFVSLHGEWAMREGWESIWVVGSSFAKRLDLVHGPELLPESWPRA